MNRSQVAAILSLPFKLGLRPLNERLAESALRRPVRAVRHAAEAWLKNNHGGHSFGVRAGELKAAGMDWTEVLAVEAENLLARLAAEILVSASCRSTMERAGLRPARRRLSHHLL